MSTNKLLHDLGVTYGTCPVCETHAVVLDPNTGICGDCDHHAIKGPPPKEYRHE